MLGVGIEGVGASRTELTRLAGTIGREVSRVLMRLAETSALGCNDGGMAERADKANVEEHYSGAESDR